MPNQNFRNYKVALYPRPAQSRALDYTLESQRHLYNCALEERIYHYEKTGKSLMRNNQMKNGVTIARNDPELPEFGAMLHVIQEGTISRLDRAYKAFFRRAQAGESPGFPKFAGKRFWKSFEYRYRNNNSLDLDICRLDIPSVGKVKFRHVGGIPWDKFSLKQAVIERDTLGKWWATMSLEVFPETPQDDGNLLGIDLNTKKNMIVYYDRGSDYDDKYGLPDPILRINEKVKGLQRIWATQTKGSNRWKKMKKRIAKLKAKAKNILKDKQHRATTEIVKRAYTIGTEKLKLKNMTKSAKGTVEEPGKNVAAKSGLNRVILEGAPGRTIQMISYKAGRHIEVNPKNTSRKCSSCGHTSADNRKTQAHFSCVSCGFTLNADVNAARNMAALAAEHVVEKAREDVKSKRESVHKSEASHAAVD